MPDESKSGLGGLLVGLASPKDAPVDEEPLEEAEDEGAADAMSVAAADVREAFNGSDDVALARALRRFIRIVGA